MSGMSEEADAFWLGVTLRSILAEIGLGTRNYPANYERAKILVGLGLAEYDMPPVPGETYWLRLTEAGRQALRALSEDKT